MSRKSWLALALAAMLGACASVPPPTEQIAVSEAAVTDARSAQGAVYAPNVLGNAQRKLDAAKAAMASGENLRARQLAEEAEVDARLAAADARSAKAKLAVAQIDAGIRALRDEMQRAQR